MEKAKPYRIRMEDRGEYLYALVGGETLKPEIAKQYWDEIADECFALRKNKIMIEKDFTEGVSAPEEMLEMGEYVGKILATKKVAFLDRHGNQAINNLGQKVAENRGVGMKVFSTAEEAEEWLKNC